MCSGPMGQLAEVAVDAGTQVGCLEGEVIGCAGSWTVT